MTTTTLNYRAIHYKITSINFPKVSRKALYILGILFCLSMLVFYIYLVNELTMSAYLIRNYNKEINLILGENKILEAHFTKASLLEQTMEKIKELGFEKTTNIKYVQILENSLAKAK